VHRDFVWYLWPRTRIFDQERGQRQEEQQDGHASESRVRMLDQEGRQSQHTQQDVLDEPFVIRTEESES